MLRLAGWAEEAPVVFLPAAGGFQMMAVTRWAARAERELAAFGPDR